MIATAKTKTSKDWRDQSACLEIDPDLFFPVGQGASAMRQTLEVRRICQTCPVMGPCLEWALETGQDDGIWGGLDPVERRALNRRRRQVSRLLSDQEASDFAAGQVSR